MIRFGSFTAAAAALAFAAGLAFAPPAAAHDSGSDTARAVAGLIALGIIAKSLDDRRSRHSSYNHSYQPRAHYRPHGSRYYAGRHHHHGGHGYHRHRSRHGGYYQHRH